MSDFHRDVPLALSNLWVRTIANRLLTDAGLYSWKVRVVDDLDKLAGYCSRRGETIFLNGPMLHATRWRNVIETIKHEMAHALTENGHTLQWREKLNELGGMGLWVMDTGEIVPAYVENTEPYA